MIPDLLWIVGFYAAAAVVAHWLIRRNSGGERRHYVLVAGNHQLQIEWYIRSIQQFARRSGTDVGITVVLDQSSDETGPIVERFTRRDTNIECVRKRTTESTEAEAQISECADNKPGRNETVVWVELGRTEDVGRLPL
ncbi:hypothetical protein D7Z26_23450 [Cohnella endophytica]|uniref:Uncharacterized protein n=1 Tax=Cohnella endophytica TaxID=2419778 RepID=A0A494XI86_9BACL|nr:hypothetical protein [Cohnella endophytica]RKP47263.1 hypothetical protein D7Z26_23450 [Cohnella endophytica]